MTAISDVTSGQDPLGSGWAKNSSSVKILPVSHVVFILNRNDPEKTIQAIVDPTGSGTGEDLEGVQETGWSRCLTGSVETN